MVRVEPAITVEEMDAVIQKHCENLTETHDDGCEICPLDEICHSVFGDFENNPYECEKAYEIITKLTPSVESNVNHPKHYNQGGIECWDAMEAAYGRESVKTFCKLNAFKYIWRANEKNGIEDIDKAINYLNKYKELNTVGGENN